MGERVLVTGGAGFIGRVAVEALLAAGADVTVLDREPYPSPDIATVLGDIRDPQVRERAVQCGLAAIFHLAAMTSVLGSLRDPVLVQEVNVVATAELLELARRRDVPHFLMASTNAVVGDSGGATIHEDMPLRPLTPYGATKAAAEMLLSGYAGGYGMTTCATRLTNVYGPGMAHKDSLIPRLMRAAKAGTAVEVYGSGRQMRDLVHVRDAVGGLLAAWRSGHVGPLIIGAGRSLTVLDVIDEVSRAVGFPVRAEHVAAKAGEMPAVVVSVDRARGLGYAPTMSLPDGLAETWADFR